MDELMKNDLLKKLHLLEKENKFQRKLKENQNINLELFNVYKEIILYFVNNRFESMIDVVELRYTLNYIIKTARIKYGEEKKVERMRWLIEKISK
ncbi:MAG: hypothetical protein PHY80_04835 [Rickettsiales bacterium]|nr:hypothetical protein [Rickettsiales bacterium]